MTVDIPIGARYGRLTVLQVIPGKKISPHRSCLCRCDCGKETVVRTQHLLSGDTKSCGCFSRELPGMRAEKIPIGTRFGRLTVLAVEPRRIGRGYLCRCDCGGEMVATPHDLAHGRTKSCGCFARDNWLARITTHGASKSPEYSAFHSAKRRCTNKNYNRWADYGGRGIQFRFKSFREFFATVGPKPGPQYSIDRYPNNDGHYEPGNVRWATREQQQANRRADIRRPTFPHGYRKSAQRTIPQKPERRIG